MPGEKGRTFIKSKMLLGVQMIFFDILSVRPFSPGGFFTFLVALAHGGSPQIPTALLFCSAASTLQLLYYVVGLVWGSSWRIEPGYRGCVS